MTTDIKKRLTEGGGMLNAIIKVEAYKTGLSFATSPDVKGLLVAKSTMAELDARIPEAIKELYAVCGVEVEVAYRPPYALITQTGHSEGG